MSSKQVEEFQQVVWKYFLNSSRDLPWRIIDPDESLYAYHVLVSEFMLQQTQVVRVIDKYQQWLTEYPNLQAVAEASQASVLKSWNGLGYNRRAKFLYETCKTIVKVHAGTVPKEIEVLKTLPGIGHNTAAAIGAYAFNQRNVFIETNIRTVFIHHFFKNRNDVADSELLPLIDASLNGDPRQWYWALMDYGTYLKKEHGNVSRRSKHHSLQSKFEGSNRQIRGLVIKSLIEGHKTMPQLKSVCQDETKLHSVLESLLKENIIEKTGVTYTLAGS